MLYVAQKYRESRSRRKNMMWLKEGKHRLPELELPRPGQRILKSICAVGLCFIVYFLSGKRGIPFYSVIAALQCMQPYQENTLAVGKRRTVGTLMGAFWGLIVILAELYGFGGRMEGTMEWYLLIACFTGVVLYSTVMLKITDSSYFSCVVFLSITIMHIEDTNPYLFVLDRVVDTLLGVVLALIVNSVHFPRRKKYDVLFVSGVDDTILNSKEKLTPYSRVELNRLIEQGMNFTVSTMRTPADVRNVFSDINLKLPVIAMDGAVLYDMKENRYLISHTISAGQASKVRGLLDEAGVCYFTNILIDDTLMIFYSELDNDAHRDIFDKMRKSPYRNFVRRPVPGDEDVLYFMILEEKERASEIFRNLQRQPWSGECRIKMYDSHDYCGYTYIKIYNREATRENMLQNLMRKLGLEKSVTFGSIEGKSDIYIKNADKNEMVKKLKSQFEPVILLQERGKKNLM